jgi:hypothetical protein
MSSEAVDRRRAIALGGLSTLVYLATAPAVVNLDGLGYLKLLPHNFAAGHLLYMPLLRLATRISGGDGLGAGRLVNALLGGSGVVLTYGIVRRVAGATLVSTEARFAATFAAAGLALSYGYWVQAADVEAYAAATVALLSTVRMVLAYRGRPELSRALAVGVLLGVSVLCHLEHVLLSFFCGAALLRFAPDRRRGLAHALVALGTGGALALGLYAWAALVVRGHDLAGALRWVGTAAHGFHDGGGVYRIADGIYGLAKAVVYSPYLYEADQQRLLGQFLLGLGPLVGLGVAAFLARHRLPPEARLGLWWLGPYALVGVAFFGSDSERWLFVLPALWLLGGMLVAAAPRRTQLAAWVLVYVGAFNLSTGILPPHRDTWPRHRAEAAAALFSDGDLVIFPGHSWDEYVSFYAAARLTPFPVVYYAARDGAEAGFARLDREVAATLLSGGHVYVVRILDESDDDPRGWKELEQLGLERAALRARITDGFVATPLGTTEAGNPRTVVRLDPAPPS